MPMGRIDFETTCNVGIIEGGTARNIVPDIVKITGEARSRDAKKLDKSDRYHRRCIPASGGPP